MSTNYCTINCKQCAAPIRIPDDKDSTFVCSSCGTTMQSKGINILIVANPIIDANFIAGDIDNILRRLVALYQRLRTSKMFSVEQDKIQALLADELAGLYPKIVQYYRTEHELTSRAFKKKYLYQELFDWPQPLDLILAGIYTLILAFRQTTMYNFFIDDDHELYAFNVVEVSKPQLNAIRK